MNRRFCDCGGALVLVAPSVVSLMHPCDESDARAVISDKIGGFATAHDTGIDPVNIRYALTRARGYVHTLISPFGDSISIDTPLFGTACTIMPNGTVLEGYREDFPNSVYRQAAMVWCWQIRFLYPAEYVNTVCYATWIPFHIRER